MAELAAGNAPGLARAALTFAYFWYNFMPLARGTAAAGYVAILGIFLAAGMPVTSPIPKVWSASCHDMTTVQLFLCESWSSKADMEVSASFSPAC